MFRWLSVIVLVGLVLRGTTKIVPLGNLDRWVPYQELFEKQLLTEDLSRPWQPADHCMQRFRDAFSASHSCDLRPHCGTMHWQELSNSWLGLDVTGICYPTFPFIRACTGKVCPEWARTQHLVRYMPKLYQRCFPDGDGETCLSILSPVELLASVTGQFYPAGCYTERILGVNYTDNGDYDCLSYFDFSRCPPVRAVVGDLVVNTSCSNGCTLRVAAQATVNLVNCETTSVREYDWDGNLLSRPVLNDDRESCQQWNQVAVSTGSYSWAMGYKFYGPSPGRRIERCEPASIAFRSPPLQWLTAALQEVAHGVWTAISSALGWIFREDLEIYEWFWINLIGVVLWLNRVLPIVEALVVFVIMSVKYGSEWPASLIVAIPVALAARFLRNFSY